MRVWGSFPERGLDQANLLLPRYEALRDQQTMFAEFAAQAFTGFTLTGSGDPEPVLLRRQLFEVSPTDPLIYAGVTAFLVGISLLACLLPARRAARVQPLAALRAD